jgi:folate-binding protein YgfZ
MTELTIHGPASTGLASTRTAAGAPTTAPQAAGAPELAPWRSPMLDLPRAVEAVEPSRDPGVAWHYGDPLGEQRAAVRSAALFDRSNRDVLAVPGADRLSWLHSICSQHVSDLHDGDGAHSLVLSPNGHVEQDWIASELAGRVWLDTEPGEGPEVLGYLQKMRFMLRVEPTDISADWAVLTLVGPDSERLLGVAGLPVPAPQRYEAAALAGGGFVRRMADLGAPRFDLLLPRRADQANQAGGDVAAIAGRLIEAGAAPAGSWAFEALRVQARQPRLRLETDHRTIPHEIELIGEAVHLDKGCYRGQETVARVHNLGRPPRRLVQLYLSGERDVLPEPGTPVELDGRAIGFLGTAAQHHELGPIALAVIKRSIPDDATLSVAGEPVAIAR